jgi:hypothetical protein
MLNEDGGVLLNINTGRCYSLNIFGAKIWTLIGSGRTREELLKELTVECSVPREQLKQDVSKFLADLTKAGVLVADLLQFPVRSSGAYALPRPGLPLHKGRLIRILTVPFLGAGCAFVLLMALDLVLKLAGFAVFYKVVQSWPVREAITKDKEPELIARVCATTNQILAYYFRRALCLQRAATTTCLLRSLGVPAEFVMGCRKYPFYGHAWVEVRGKVINDPQNVQKFFSQMDRC